MSTACCTERLNVLFQVTQLEGGRAGTYSQESQLPVLGTAGGGLEALEREVEEAIC